MAASPVADLTYRNYGRADGAADQSLVGHCPAIHAIVDQEEGILGLVYLLLLLLCRPVNHLLRQRDDRRQCRTSGTERKHLQDDHLEGPVLKRIR